MKKVLLLICLFVVAIGYSQQTTVKENGVDNPIYYNQQKQTKTVSQPNTAIKEAKTLGENSPIFYNQQKKTTTVGQQNAANSPALSVPKSNGANNPIVFSKQQKPVAQTISDFTYTGRSATDVSSIAPLEKSLFGTSGFTTSGLEGKTTNNPSAGTASLQGVGHKPLAPVVITHSLSQSIVAGNSVTCNAGGIPKENSFFRDFNLAADFGITGAFNVTSAEFAVEAVSGATNLTLNVYSTTTAFPGGYPGSATLQGTASYTSTTADANKVISVPLTATIPAGAIMIYELKINAGATFSWFPGSNAAGQTGKSWIMSADCSLTVPTDLAGMGFPNQHMVMNIVGEEGGGGGGPFPDPYCGPIAFSTVEPITLVEIAGISNRSSAVINGSPAHEDFTSVVGAMTEGQTYPLALEGNTAGGFTCYFVVFIDWNQDGVLDNASERYEIGSINNSTGEDGKQLLGNIVVPAGVAAGPTRMRVMKKFSTPYPADSCEGSSYGQAEDYTINVTTGGGGGGTCATPVLEVNQDVDDTCMATIGQGGLAQSYVAQEPNAAGAGIKFRDPSTGLNVDLSLWDGLPNAGGTMLTSGTSQTDGTNWADVMWDDVVSVTVGSTYYIVIDGNASLPCISGSTANPYSGGMVYANNYSPFPTFDYTFRTYSCDSGGGGGGTACSQDNPENNFENGYTTSSDQGQRIAFDITVPVDTDFTLNTATVNIWMNPGSTVTSSDITFYSDAAGAPGTAITTQAAVVPTSQAVIGNNFGFDISEVVFDIAPEMLAGQAGVETTYWVVFGVNVSAGSGFISATTASIEGYEAYFAPDGVTWSVIGGSDIVYNFEGDCEPIGGGGGTACGQDNPENNFENGYTTSSDQGQRIAFDITVPVDTDFTLNTATVNIWMNPGSTVTSSDITFYSDAAGAPGTAITTQAAVVPTSQAVIGNNFGFDISEVVFDIAPEMLAGQAGVETTYWVVFGVNVSAGSGFISATTASIEGYEAYFAPDGVTWSVIGGSDIVYNFEGECEAIGGGGTGGPCSASVPSNSFENGKSFTKNLGRITAADITIAADEDMMLETINITAFIGSVGSGVNASNVDVFIYADSGTGSPGALLTSQLSLVPASQTVIGNNFGYDAWSVDLDIADFNLPGQAGVPTTYWIGLSLEPTDGSNTFWEFTSAGVNGYGLAYDDGTGYIIEPGNEVVYTFAGTCSPIGGSSGPPNDECSGAIAMSCGDSVAGTTVDATIDSSAPACGPSITSPGVWYTLDDTSGMAGEITFSMCDGTTNFDTKISVYTGSCSALVCVDGNDDSCGLQSSVTVPSNGNTKFYILVHSFGGATGTFTLSATCTPTPPPNDKIVNSIDVDEVGFPYTDPAVAMPAATPENGNPAGCDLTGANGVWYNFVSAGDGTANATIITPGGASSVTFYTAPNENSVETDLTLVPQQTNQCGPGTTASIYTLAGQAYYVFVLNTAAITDIVIDGTNLGVANNAIEGFTYYPNPTNGLLNLSSRDNIEMVTVYNLLGQKVLTEKVGATSTTLDISGLSTGTYMMKATVNGQVGVYKIIKN